MPNGVKLELSPELINLVDSRRGDLTRDEFLLRILNEHLASLGSQESSEENFIEIDSEAEQGKQFLLEFVKNFQRFTNNVNERLDRLEGLVNNIPGKTIETEDIETDKEMYDETELEELDEESDDEELDADEDLETNDYYADDEEYNEKESYSVGDQDGEPLVFELMENGEGELEDEEYTGEYSAGSSTSDEFEYGCPFCNATIDSNATYCPHCGNRFDDVGVFERDPVVVEPLSEGYTDTGEYDPRPKYLKRSTTGQFDEHKPSRLSSDRPSVKRAYDSRIRLCTRCGGKLSYLDKYKRWYCYTCKQYEGAQEPRSYSPSPTISPEPEVKPRKQVYAINRGTPDRAPPPRPDPRDEAESHAKPHLRRNKPLKDYYKYAD
ncbi:zinc ribbon domain-containing protein [[Eubacterium] cellulosolvens]